MIQISLRLAERLSIIVLVFYGILILWLSFRIGSGSPQEIPHIDKLAHFCAYLGYALFATLWIKDKRAQRWLFLLLFILGGMIELIQGLIPGRDRSILDVLANSAGAFIGALLSFKMHPFCRSFFFMDVVEE